LQWLSGKSAQGHAPKRKCRFSFPILEVYLMTGLTISANRKWKIPAMAVVSVFASFLMTDAAFADGPGGIAALGNASGLMQLVPIILIFVVFYFLLIRPQQKQAKKHQQFLNDLKRGTKIVTNGGIHGIITDMDGNVLTLEIAKDVRVKISRNAVAGAVTKDGAVNVETADPKSSSGS